MTLAELNGLEVARAEEELRRCCGSRTFVRAMVARRPFSDEDELVRSADEVWAICGRGDILEAFAAHPRIGSKNDVEKKEGSERSWAEGEQAGARTADEVTLSELALANQAYEARFGFIYIVCATGKSAPEMLELCRVRLAHEPEAELAVAAAEQHKITILRLRKLISA